MEYVCDRDYEYIKNKYHDTKKPYNSFGRFVRHDEIFDEDSGTEYYTLKGQVMENDAKIEHLSHNVRKATAFAKILEGTRISCDNRDRFPAINAVSRPLSDLQNKWRKELFGEILPEVGKRTWELEKAGTVTIWPDFDHAVPDWNTIYNRSFSGILEDSERSRKSKAWGEDEESYFEGVKITYEAIIAFIDRLAERAERTEGSQRMAKALRNIAHNPPKTFYEALLVNYLYFMTCEHIDNMQVRSLGNFDRELYPFYKNDLANGVSEEEIRTDLAYFLLQFTSIDNYWNQPVYLGGCDENDIAITNELRSGRAHV